MENNSTKEICKMEKKAIPWTARQLVGAMKKGTATFDSAVQRTHVWKADQKSLLIHSLIINAPVPSFYATKGESGYDFLDGKQRSNAIYEYMEDMYALEGVPEIEYDDDSTEDINGKKFSELTEEMQEEIKSYTLNIVYYDNLDEDQMADIFYRLNNSTPLKAIEKMRVKCPSLKAVQTLCQHELITTAVNDKQKTRYTDEDIVIKSFAMLRSDEPCLDVKEIRPFTEGLLLKEEEISKLNSIFDMLLDIHSYMKNIKAAKRVLSRTHLVTLVKFLDNHEEANRITLTAFFDYFYDGGKTATVSDVYNAYANSGSGHATSIKERLKALDEHFAEFTKETETEAETEIEADNNFLVVA